MRKIYNFIEIIFFILFTHPFRWSFEREKLREAQRLRDQKIELKRKLKKQTNQLNKNILS